MKILVSALPTHSWWGTGITAYDDNWGMQDGVIPNQSIVEEEHHNLVAILKQFIEVEVIPFPNANEFPNINDDFVFTRDQFISGHKHSVVICNLRRPERKGETEYVETFFRRLGINFQTLPQTAIADGGEFYYTPKEKILFAGLSRNNKEGVEEMARLLGVNELVLVETKAYHLDTVFTVILDKEKRLHGIITSLPMLKKPDELIHWIKTRGIELITVNPEDTIGHKDQGGSQAVNSLALPGVLISNNYFQTPGAEEQLAKLGITHVITSTTQFNLSGGSIHCLTNEL